MSKHETWRTRKYWQSVGGLLIEEFVAVKGTKDKGSRLIDGLIVLGEDTKLCNANTFDITGKDVIVIQTKKTRLGMYLLGQTYFSSLLIEKHKPKSVKAVAICGKNDEVMQELADQHNIEVVVIPENKKFSSSNYKQLNKRELSEDEMKRYSKNWVEYKKIIYKDKK